MNNLDAFRPIPFYFLTTRNPADYTKKAVDDAMDAVKQAGFGGIVFFNKPPHGFGALRAFLPRARHGALDK